MIWLNVSVIDVVVPPYVIPAIIMIGMFCLVFYRFAIEYIFKM